MGFLADVNLLFALLYAGHSHTSQAIGWLERLGEADRVLLCRVVQMGVLRLLTNPPVMGDEVLTPRQAWSLWDRLGTDPRFAGIDEPPRLESTWRRIDVAARQGGRIETDSYLAAFALSGGFRLVTFDRGFRRYPELDVLILDPPSAS